MKGRLTEVHIAYVLDHFEHHVFMDAKLRSRLFYGEKPGSRGPGVYFPASDDPYDPDKVWWWRDIPVLYPMDKEGDTMFRMEGKYLVFSHDLIKSAFHLLSGYGEYFDRATDRYGRYPFESSIQFQLGIIKKPVVNYYFNMMLEGLAAFAGMQGFNCRYEPVFKNPVFMLSHDIDRIGGYSFFETGFRFKQLLGLAGSPLPFNHRFREAFRSLIHLLNPFSRQDPFWTFEDLMQWESERGFRSTYFFLEREGGRKENSVYRFHSRKFRQLFRQLSENGHEIALHGTMQSSASRASMVRTLKNLQQASPEEVSGIRQHFLKVIPGTTLPMQESAGLQYDASLGFAEQDGFRNSYCWPFRLFDFTNNRPMSLWEIPLTVMEVTHFQYRKLDLESSRKAIEELAAEVFQFNGVFSLLWHNHFFDENAFPGVTGHYRQVLDYFKDARAEGITGREIIARITSRST